MSAPLGALLYQVGQGLNTVRLVNLREDVKRILAKNGFLTNCGQPKRPDTFATTIEQKRFEPNDDRYFAS